MPFSRAELVERYRALRRERRDGYARWVLLIKELRTEHGLGVLEAERMALANPHRRKWVERQINIHRRCRKYALAHIHHNGRASLIEREGETFNFRIR